MFEGGHTALSNETYEEARPEASGLGVQPQRERVRAEPA